MSENNMEQVGQPRLSFLSLGGIEDVTKNMYLYEYGDEVLIVDCGIGFADETMLGVDLLLPDISYLLDVTSAKGRSSGRKKIVGMVLTHGHEDHIGALPFILPQLPPMPIFASPLTAALANEKLKSFNYQGRVQSVPFNAKQIVLGVFSCSFIRVTHSIPDTAHIIIKTPVGTIYHGSDYKFDPNPYDGKKSDIEAIRKIGEEGVLCLVSDCLGAERHGHSMSEDKIFSSFSNIIKVAPSRVIITTYSSHVSRINQIIDAAKAHGRKVCFLGRSLQKIKSIAKNLGYLHQLDGVEVPVEELSNLAGNKIVLIVAGSQGQESSALMRMANDMHRDVVLQKDDTVVFSSDIIPGNELIVYSMIDAILKKGVRVLYKDTDTMLHVSGHGSQGDLQELAAYLRPVHMLPISGMYRQMKAYQDIMQEAGYSAQAVKLLENGQKIFISKQGIQKGEKIAIKNVFVDEISGEEVEHFVLHDREKLAKDGMVVIIAQMQVDTGKLLGKPDIIARGFMIKDVGNMTRLLTKKIQDAFSQNKHHTRGWVYIRKTIEGLARRAIRDGLNREPLVLAVVIEV